MNSVKIGNYQMDTAFGLYLPEYTIPAPAPQTKFIDIIGRDGAVDLSNAFGEIHFKSREWTLDFKCFNPAVNWLALSSTVMNAIHGKRLNFTFDDDPNWYWTGRVMVQNYTSKKGEGTLRIKITSDPYKYANLTHIVTSAVPVGEETFTSALVSIDNDQLYRPVSLSVPVSPVQDLHGYASPWGPGGGNNLVKVAVANNRVDGGITYTEDEFGTVHCSGTATAESFSAANVTASTADQRCIRAIPAGTYTIANIGGARLWVQFRNADNTANLATATNVAVGNSVTKTFNEPVIIYIRADIASGTVIDADMQVVVTAGSTAATVYTPYKNICPITGSTSTSVRRTGKNLLPKSTSTDGLYNGLTIMFNADGSMTLDGTTTGVVNICFPNYGYTFFVPNGNYILSGGVNSYVYMTFHDGVDSTGTRYDNTSGDTPVTITTGSVYNMRLVVLSGRTLSNLTIYPMLRPAGTNNTFVAPRNRDVYTANWSTQAGEVYGCMIDFVSGVLKVDRYKFVTTWSAGTNSTMYDNNTKERRRFSYYSAPADDKTKITSALCNVAKYIPSDTTAEWAKGSVFSLHGSNQYMSLCLPSDTDGATEIELCYYLANPVEYQLTPSQIKLLTGQNNIWASNGAIITADVVKPVNVENAGSKSVVPSVTASSDMTLTWDDFSYSMQAGTSVIPQLSLNPGDNYVYVDGTGTISFEFREGSL